MNKINLLFATDNNYVQHVSVVLVSIFDNNPNSYFHIYYIIDDISSSNEFKLLSLLENYNCKLEFIYIRGELFDNMATSYHFSRGVYYRLMMAETIKEDKILYLDADILALGNIENLYNTDIDNYLLAAILNPGFTRQNELLMDSNSKYFNAGVLLVNLFEWRKFNVLQKCLDYMSFNRENIQLADQDVLNAVIDGRWKILNPIYNQQVVFFENLNELRQNSYSDSDILSAIKSPIIVHFSGSYKPWNLGYSHPFKYRYWKYLLKTPFFIPYLVSFFSMKKIFRYLTNKLT